MTAKKIRTKPFDVAEHLRDEEDIQLYLAETLKEGSHDEFISALSTAARARGMTLLAKEAGLNRESLYKALSPDSKPRFETIMKITSALGMPLTVADLGAGKSVQGFER